MCRRHRRVHWQGRNKYTNQRQGFARHPLLGWRGSILSGVHAGRVRPQDDGFTAVHCNHA
eukprot:10397426-Lingulodinium_polyedra.AAC.1